MNLEDGRLLVKLARDSISTFFSNKLLNLEDTDIFSEKQGVFVTLNKFDKLRGCIGFPEPVYPLQRAVIEAARAAAFHDPRFPSVEKDELDDITVEISVLTVPILLEADDYKQYLDMVEIGKHGLIIHKGYSSGLLLPQVFTEYECTPKMALEMVCQKAGLGKEDWKSAKLFTFEAIVFKEVEPNGDVVICN